MAMEDLMDDHGLDVALAARRAEAGDRPDGGQTTDLATNVEGTN